MMPGKVNPVLAECLDMVCFQVIGADTVVFLAAQAGQLELNVMTPVAVNNILQSLALLNNYLPVFEHRCVAGIRANRERCRELAERDPSMATMLAPKIGYLETSRIVKESIERKATIGDLAVSKGLVTRDEAEDLLDLKKAARSRYD
jgi:aspartate ammonia-lyase